MVGRKPIYRNDVSRRLGQRRRELGLSREAFRKKFGIDTTIWERAARPPMQALSDHLAPARAFRNTLGVTVKELSEIALGTWTGEADS